ncbi:hemolysin-type calcium-binding repeat 2 copies family protein [Asticcacaulis biprosthecium C19]|uniref:Hemolysin-type calcium-binding repeat 2 copies family protein n=2 Tax=Asticcacaulis biprosthecium TaxID=76891 RepID=F4QM39_9CAUL|nr:hemolysin-type calcium-binding repeat 2 copies family protein [Asticcacaulis biprosthecium C19]
MSERLSQYWDAGQNRYEFSGDQSIDAVLIGSRWTDTDLTFSFPSSGAYYDTPYYDSGYLADHVVFNTVQKGAARYAFALIAGYSLLTFNEVTETEATHATIRLSQTNDASLEAAEGNFPGSNRWDGDVWLGLTDQPFYLTPQVGNWGMTTILHEIGHTMGLKHGHSDYTTYDLTDDDYVDKPGPRFGTRALDAAEDNWAHSVMTYRSASGYDTDFQGDEFNQPQTYMQNDIAALQYLYGANFGFNSGNTTYTFDIGTGEMFVDGVGQGTPELNVFGKGLIFRTVWDGNGVDTYNFSNFYTHQSIDLNPGAWSTMSSGNLVDLRPKDDSEDPLAPGNLANALLFEGDTRSLIENAKGGSGHDTIVGNQAANTLDGNGGSDTINGGTGNDWLYGDTGLDTLNGGSGDDDVFGGDGKDALYGASGNDFLNGDDDDDQLLGEAGNDYLNGGAGSDILVGSTGNDTYVVDDIGDYLFEAAGGGSDLVYAYVSETLAANFEQLTLLGGGNIDGTGNSISNVINGNGYNNILLGGGGGIDTINGNGGDDYIWNTNYANHALNGGTGNDTIGGAFAYGGTWDGGTEVDLVDMTLHNWAATYNLTVGTYATSVGTLNIVNFENVNAGEQNDVVNGNAVANLIYGNGGNDSLVGGGGADSLYGGDGHDTLDTGVAESNDNFADGGAGDDAIWSSGEGTYAGGLGNDYIRAGLTAGLAEVLDGGEGLDTLDTTSYQLDYVLNLSTGLTHIAFEDFDNFEHAVLGGGNDSVIGTDASNNISTGMGNDSVDGGAGADTLTGGAGDDIYVVDSSADHVIETTGNGNDVIRSSVSYSLAGRVVETLTLTGNANINATGNGNGNRLNGNAGNNVLDGSIGNDTLTGGLGNDSYYVSTAGDSVVEAAGEGTDTIFSAITLSLAGRQVENLTLLGDTALNAIGNGVGNVLTGNNGGNVLDGGGGHDRLNGGLGADSLIGGTGSDTYVVDHAGDTVTELAGGGTDLVESSISFTLGAQVEQLTLTGAAAINGTGNDLNNVLTGNGANNILSGGLGNDTYFVQNTGDNVVEAGGAGSDVIYSTVTYSLNGRFAEAIYLKGEANIDATGNSLANQLVGNSGNNVLNGKGGADTVTGGFGADVFLFQTGSGADTINDFSAADNDSIHVNAYTGGVANNALVVQNGLNVVINLGGGNIITVIGALEAQVEAQMVW